MKNSNLIKIHHINHSLVWISSSALKITESMLTTYIEIYECDSKQTIVFYKCQKLMSSVY